MSIIANAPLLKSARFMLQCLYGGKPYIERRGRHMVVHKKTFMNNYGMQRFHAVKIMIRTMEKNLLVKNFTWDESFFYFDIILPDWLEPIENDPKANNLW